MTKKIHIGTRGSALALWQAEYVERSIAELFPEIEIERVIIKTEGDRDQKSSLTRIGGQGVFTKTIEDALLSGKIDAAVHSLKDLPSSMPDELTLIAVPERGPVEDVLISSEGVSLKEMPIGARIATGSIRRRCQLLKVRPDLQLADLRGNIHTRLRKMREQNLHGIIMARAALVRLAITDVNYYVFDPEMMIPAVGQGALGIQIRKNDRATAEALKSLNHPPTFNCVTAERSLLRTLDTGCQFPVGAHAVIKNNRLFLRGFVGGTNGDSLIRGQVEGAPENAEELGKELAQKLIELGARKLLEDFRMNHGTTR
ncbi:MAG: hydroxymethylbilane synthase [Calditrichaeota bacterium]|nr:hydroxymethylbilane synthase [Calditrichota bacterium]